MGRSPIEIMIDRACGIEPGKVQPARHMAITVCPMCEKSRDVRSPHKWPKGAAVRLRSCRVCDPMHLDAVTYHKIDGTQVV